MKTLKDGTVNRHVYYLCSKSKDRHCKVTYLNEVDLINQFIELIDKIDLNEIGIKEKIREEVEKVKKFQRIILGTKEKIEVNDIDIRNYAKYVLREAKNEDKRDLMSCFKSQIVMEDKKISLS